MALPAGMGVRLLPSRAKLSSKCITFERESLRSPYGEILYEPWVSTPVE